MIVILSGQKNKGSTFWYKPDKYAMCYKITAESTTPVPTSVIEPLC